MRWRRIFWKPFWCSFTKERAAPREILLSHPLEEATVMQEALSTLAGRKVEICVPKRGDKREVMDGALRNARMALKRHLDRKMGEGLLLEALAEQFELARVPERIEVYDNSHISGSHAVGAMIVAGPEGFQKQHYRKFHHQGSADQRRFRHDARGAAAAAEACQG